MSEPTSVKELIQGMMPPGAAVIRGRVTSADPLVIVAVNDDKLVLNANTLIVPRHLTDYATTCDIMLDGGTIDSQTHKDGAHPHGPGGGHAQQSGDGVHSHPGSEGAHSHPSSEGAHVNRLETFDIFGATIKVYNALKVGETVHLLSFNQGKKYYVLDREVQ